MATDVTRRWALRPVTSRLPWVAYGLAVQALGVGSVAVVMWKGIRNQSFGSHVTAQMIKFAWHSELHTRTGLILLVVGAVVYAFGSVVMARPFVTRPLTLFVAVPIAAVAGMLLLGVLALVIAALVAAAASFDLPDLGGGGSGRRGRRRRGQQ